MSRHPEPERLEGVYISWGEYPPGGFIYASTLFTVEQVNADRTYDRIVLTPDRARTVVAQLTEGLRLLAERLNS